MSVEFMELQKVMASCNLSFLRGQKCFPNSTDTDKTTMKQIYFFITWEWVVHKQYGCDTSWPIKAEQGAIKKQN